MDELDQLGHFASDDAFGADEGRGESRRTLIALAAATGLGTLAVVVTIWVISFAGASPSSGLRGAPAGDSIAGALSTGTASDDATPTEDVSADATPTTVTSTFVPPSPTAVPVSTPTLSLPPPEQPTFTLTASAPSTTAPVVVPPPPTVVPPTVAPPPLPGLPVVSGVVLTCRRAGDQTRASLTFRTTAPVPVYLVGGGKPVAATKGPGPVALQVGGSRTGYCFATVGAKGYGPIAAS